MDKEINTRNRRSLETIITINLDENFGGESIDKRINSVYLEGEGGREKGLLIIF